MIKHLRVINMAVGLVFACASMAQTMTSLPYNMSFEASEVAELQNWHFNTGSEAANCSDQWMVGTDQQSDGKRSLYISDNGSTAHFGAAHNVQFAYRDFLLPQGSYIVSFDWKNMGAPNATLYVGFGRTTSLPCEASSTTGVLTQAYISASQHAQLRGQRYWQNARLTGVNSNGTRAIRIFFAWCSDNQDTTWMNPLGACIDNIEIRKANFAPPTSLNIDASCDTTYVTWTGTCDSYQLEYKKSGDALWHSRSGLYASGGTGNLILEQLQEGMYDFRIRGFYGTDVSTRDTTVYTYANSYFVFCPDNHCINYVNLHDTTGSVVCHYGHINSSGVIDQTSTGVIDNGPNSVSSRHTVNWDLDAYDSRTHNQLPLVPIGEFASVRLGNWNDGGEWESVTYNYLVDSAYAILLLKYAVVLEDPGHDKEDQPRFTLSIKDEFGQEVDPECGSADFYAGRNSGNKGGGWHYEPDLSWKEWTTYGVDLTQYIGQSLQITVTTYDCTWQGHYGYAYFCLGCAKAKIETLSCGDDSKMTAQAPDGFAYEWRSIHNMDTVVSYERTLEVDASDTTTYICKLTYLDQEECFFELRSSVLPRFPVAFYSYKYEPTNCENRVVFNNLSHIVVKYEGDPQGTHHWDEPCEEYEWVINNERFSDVNPIYIFPQEGGRFPVSLFASISDGKCTDDTTFYVDVPTIGDVVLNIDQEICYGSSFTLGSKTYNTSGVYSETFESRAGCDSTCILNLTVLPQNLTNLPDTSICAESVYMLDGDVYPFEKTGQWIRHKFNVHGCDSTIIQYVTVMDTIKPSIDVTFTEPKSPSSIIGVTSILGFIVSITVTY